EPVQGGRARDRALRALRLPRRERGRSARLRRASFHRHRGAGAAKAEGAPRRIPSANGAAVIRDADARGLEGMTADTLAVIGGSGLYDFDGFTDVEELTVDTPFGPPSDRIVRGRMGETTLLFLPRHG